MNKLISGKCYAKMAKGSKTVKVNFTQCGNLAIFLVPLLFYVKSILANVPFQPNGGSEY